ncbi:hypothetical protein [Synechococcus elongatus]|uniref:Uncharacterized protein n=2 Tax=Synechococcus elongatus TaxID=32046 RepID=Q31ML5_SYNE7|nr:hypothetical protein [Synechococcus elongatus]ABB57704.1 conserved hypothetical protein [Synechococcus elongatus PCC 7942 = FACHB-805]AJD57806.1 hypothetical protein M744_08115 [Synechococcus elongatus UTEX 2973]MBD2586419.1 hypothetical protein [Synechococcus elongatus FACHB-242]MBD2687493.1 hypothetical protein [Synechococcus elongatus FACHB-1061]MBD2706798.1 hypothetical protein [Synechococcus elongatus PCC 7942 = FACHB-805]
MSEETTPRTTRRSRTAANPEEALTLAAQPVDLEPKSSLQLPQNRPISPSSIEVAKTVAIAGRRPIARWEAPDNRNLRQAPKLFNRPIASNEPEDAASLMGYLD